MKLKRRRDITFIVFLFFFTLPDKTKNRNNIYLFISLILSYFINLIYKNVLNYENKEKENKNHNLKLIFNKYIDN